MEKETFALCPSVVYLCFLNYQLRFNMTFDGYPEYPKEGFCACGNITWITSANPEGLLCCECLVKLARIENNKWAKENT